MRNLVIIHIKINYESRPYVLLWGNCNGEHIDFVAGRQDRVRRWEEDAEAILHMMPCLPTDKLCNLGCEC